MLLLALIAHAELPLGPYPDCGPDGGCPSDFGGWDQLSWIPDKSKNTVREPELEMGSGMSLDRAFQKTTGRWEAVVAILDSGIYWQDTRLYDKILLNTDELPQPQHTDGTPVEGWDLDGNGLVNLSDYAEDPRVDIAAGVDATDNRLDPSDLIHTFSDGVDDDGNGYVDDIAGWDFFGWDNDPYAALQKGYANHGTGVMKAAAEGGEDGGGIGVCPNCAILPVRVGDTFITDGDRVGLGIAFAADRGAASIGMALGAISNPSTTHDAIEYADAMGVTLVAAAGDENSYHHNLPAVDGRLLYVHSVRGDTADEGNGGVYSFQSFFNCNNYGPRVDLVAGTADCATGATARIAGAAALIASAGLDNGFELAPDEVRALLRGSADDVYLTPEELDISGTYPSQPGWDAYYGYGRLDVGEAVQRVFAGEIPPIARLDSPAWFSHHEGSVVVQGTASAPRSSVASWTLYLGRGAEPDSWDAVASGEGPASGTLSVVDLSHLDAVPFEDLQWFDGVVERMDRAHAPLVQIRLVVEDAEGRTSEERRGVWVQPDPDLLPNFPLDMGASLETSPHVLDLDGDGIAEIVQAASNGWVHVLDGTGTEHDGFPVGTNPIEDGDWGWHDAAAFTSGAVDVPREGILSTPAIGDLDGDGDLEIVATTLRGGVYAWHHDGAPVDGFPVRIVGRTTEEYRPGFSYDDGFAGSPALGDADGDGQLDIVIGAGDQRLYAWSGSGELLDGYPIELCAPELCGVAGARIVSSAALGDIDNDGDLDAAIGTNEVPSGAAGLLYVVDLASATIWEGYPLGRDGLINQSILPVVGEGHPTSPILADLDGDGDLEMVSQPMLSNTDPIQHDGTDAIDLKFTADSYGEASSYGEGSIIGMVNNPVFGDLDMDGTPDMVMGGASATYLVSLALTSVLEYQHGMGAWRGSTGESFHGWPRQVDDVAFLTAPAIAEITGDYLPEVVYGSGGYLIYASDAVGNPAPGWPKFTGGWALATPAVGDIDGDGRVEVVVGTREGHLFAWRTDGASWRPAQWTSLRHDPANTGNFQTPIDAAERPASAEEAGCCSDGEPDAAWLLFAPLFLVLRRRRRG